MMTTRLGQLRSDLSRLRSTRQLIRQVSGLALLVQSLMLILVAAFLFDWLLDMSAAQRVILLSLMAAALVWSFRRFVRPWFGQTDDLVELALSVEQRQGIDSDLVSALQFERPEAHQWGSPQLESAVITQVVELSPSLNVFEGLSLDDFRKRLIRLAVAIVVPLSASACFPGYLDAFLNRIVLGAAAYPTDTEIVEVLVNGEVVIRGQDIVLTEIASPVGHPVVFNIRYAGETPAIDSRLIRIVSKDGDVSTEVQLTGTSSSIGQSLKDGTDAIAAPEKHSGKTDESAEPSTDADAFTLQGELPRLMSSVTFEALIGDARTPSVTINAIPLPIVETELTVTPPEYARNSQSSSGDHSVSQRALSVLEGSRVDLTIRSLNKPLELVQLQIDGREYRLVPNDDSRREWSLVVRGTVFQAVSEPIRYQITARDKQGLELESPIHGTIRLRTDQPPRLSISVRTRKIVASAQPPITWSASDDFGLSQVTARVQVSRSDGTAEESEVEVSTNAESTEPAVALRGVWPLDLSAMELVKGDELKVTFAATDFRGEAAPATSYSEPIMLQVTDRQGILSGLLETDEESARQLDAIIRRELGIGESK